MVLQYFTQWLVSFLCGGLVSLGGVWIATRKKRRKKRKALEDGVQCLLRAEIIRQYEKWIDRGFCPIYAKEALKREYASYHDLDGNDVATELFEKVLDLPTELPHEHK